MSLLLGVAVAALVAFPMISYVVMLAVSWQLGDSERPEPSRSDTGRQIPGGSSDRGE